MTSFEQLIHFHILINSCLSVLEIINLNKSDSETQIEYSSHIVLSYIKKYLTRLGEMTIFSPRLENYQFSLDIFDRRQHYIPILHNYVCENDEKILWKRQNILHVSIFSFSSYISKHYFLMVLLVQIESICR